MKKILTLLMRERPSYFEIYILTFLAFLGCLGVLIGIFMLVEYSGFEKKEYFIENLGYLGSYFSGLTSIFILIATFIAVYFSYKSFREERHRIKKQLFEDHFFHLLQIHRENVKNIQIDTIDARQISGVKAILWMFRELMLIVDLVKQLHGGEFEKKKKLKIFTFQKKRLFKKKLKNKCLFELSYYCFFIGIGKRSNRTLRYYLEKKFSNEIYVDNLIDYLSNNIICEKIRKKENFPYKLCGGHQARLGHYYRHLFHTIKLIDSFKSEKNEDELYKDYVRKLRIQLNTYEQALLIINSLSLFGEVSQEYILKYRLVKNIPKNFYDEEKEIDLEEIIGDLKTKFGISMDSYFEYEEEKNEK